MVFYSWPQTNKNKYCSTKLGLFFPKCKLLCTNRFFLISGRKKVGFKTVLWNWNALSSHLATLAIRPRACFQNFKDQRLCSWECFLRELRNGRIVCKITIKYLTRVVYGPNKNCILPWSSDVFIINHIKTALRLQLADYVWCFSSLFITLCTKMMRWWDDDDAGDDDDYCLFKIIKLFIFNK